MRAGTRQAIAIIALGGMIALLASGCGGSSKKTSTTTTTVAKPLSKAAYDKRMTAIGKGLSTSIGTLGSATTAAAAATALVKVQADLRSAVKQVNALTPPAKVRAQTRQLASAVAKFAKELDPVIAKLKAGNLQALASVTTLAGLTDIQTAAAAITKAGYKISA